MECRFLYTPKEIRSALAVFRRLNLVRTLTLIGILWIIFGGIFAWSIVSEMQNTNQDITTEAWLRTMMEDAGILFFPFFFTAFYFSPFRGLMSSHAFRRNPLFNQSVLYQVEEAGFTLQSQVISQSASWAAVGKAGESAQGFILFWGKSKRLFHWLPKHGFSSENEINACRDLIQKHIPDFRRVG